METGTHSPWVSRLLESLDHPVIVANARKLKSQVDDILQSFEKKRPDQLPRPI